MSSVIPAGSFTSNKFKFYSKFYSNKFKSNMVLQEGAHSFYRMKFPDNSRFSRTILRKIQVKIT